MNFGCVCEGKRACNEKTLHKKGHWITKASAYRHYKCTCVRVCVYTRRSVAIEAISSSCMLVRCFTQNNVYREIPDIASSSDRFSSLACSTPRPSTTDRANLRCTGTAATRTNCVLKLKKKNIPDVRGKSIRFREKNYDNNN